MMDEGNISRPAGEPRVPDRPMRDWYEDEPSLRSVIIRELQRLKRRTKASPIPVFAVAIALTALALYRISTKPKDYQAEVVLRVTEGNLSDEKGAPLPEREIKEYVYSFVLNKRGLETDVINKYGYFKDEYENFGLDVAVQELRSGLDIGVHRNYFNYSRRYESQARSLRISINYTDKDPERAYKIAKVLSDMVVDNEAARRLEEARFAAKEAQQVLDKAEADARRRVDEFNAANFEKIRAQVAGDNRGVAAAQVIIDELTAQITFDEVRLADLRRRAEAIVTGFRLEEQNLAFIWEVASVYRPQAIPPPGPVRLPVLAIALLCILVPLCAIGFGTFDSKIHDSEDVTRLGLPIVGHVPSFPGDEVGSLSRRGALGKPGFVRGIFRNRRLRDNRVAYL